MSTEELRQARDTLIEALRRSDLLTLEGRALFRRYTALSEAAASAAGGMEVDVSARTAPLRTQPVVPARPAVPTTPGVPTTPSVPAVPARPAPADDDEFGGSFMVRPDTSPTSPGYRETPTQQGQQPPPDLPRSLRDRRR